MDARYIAVLEIGSSKVKGAVARRDSDGTTLVATHEVPAVNCVRHGRVQNVQEVAARADEVLRRLENDPAVAPRHITRLRIALGGRSVSSVHAVADVRLPAEVEITDETVARLKRDAVASLPADRHILAVLPRSFTVDGAQVSRPVGTFGTSIHADMTVVLASPDNRTNLDRVRLTGGGSQGTPVERVYIPRQLAIARMALTPSEQQIGVALVDMGSETTTISIHREGSLQALVTLPMGGRNITRDLATGLSITEEQAEYIKTNQASAIPDPQLDTTAEAHEISSYTQARAGEIIANVMHRIEQAGFKNADLPGGIVLTGRASRMRRMAELFETQTKMRVRTAPADNSVSPGNTGLDPLDSLDIMALVAWPDADNGESDLTELPSRKEPEDDVFSHKDDSEEYDDYNRKRPTHGRNWRGDDDFDDNNLLKDDDKIEREREEREKRRRHEEEKERRRKEKGEIKLNKGNIDKPENEPDTDPDNGGRFGRLRNIITSLGKGFMGNKGPQDIDDDL